MSRPFRTITPSSTVAPDVDGSSPHGDRRLPRPCIETGRCAVMHLQIPCPRSRDAADDHPFHHRQSPTRRRRSGRDVDPGRAAAVPRRPRRPRARGHRLEPGRRGGRAVMGVAGAHAAAAAGAGGRAARADGPYGRVHLRPPALLRRAARRRRPRRPCGVPGVPRAGRAARGGGDVHAVRDGVPRRRAAPDAHGPHRRPCTPSTRASPATTCGASSARARSTPARRGCCTTGAPRAWTSSGSTSPTWAGSPSAASWSSRSATRSWTSPPAGTRRCRWSTSRRTRSPSRLRTTGTRLPPVTVRYRGGATVPVDLAARVGVGTARVMFVNFAIQGLNDLFATPDDDYQPPRSYTRLTMRDEAASYSSRPGSEENTVGDGYAFTIDAHRRYGIPQMWAMNGGLATLLAHDCPDDVAAMRRDVEAGLLVPVVAGYGAHRLPYYTAGTNVDAIRFGARVLEKVLGAARPVYYPDQRLTTCKDNVAGALRSAGMEYVVVDAGTGQGAVPEGAEEAGGNTAIAHAKPPMGALARRAVDELAVRLAGPAQRHEGAVHRQGDEGRPVRRRRRHRGPRQARADHPLQAPGAGERTGRARGQRGRLQRRRGQGERQRLVRRRLRHARREQLPLPGGAVVAGHPPVGRGRDHGRPHRRRRRRRAGPAAGQRPLHRGAVAAAHDPPAEGHDNGLAYDTWYAAWADTPAAWLGETLRAVSDRAEQAIERAPRPTTRTTRTSCCCSPACTSSCACTSRSGRSGRGSSPATTASTTARTSSPPSRCSCATRTCTWRRATGRGGRATEERGRTATTGRWWRRSRRRASPARRPGGGGPSRPGCSGTTTRWPTSCSTTSTRWWSSTATAAGSRSCSRWSAAGRSR